MQLDFDMYFFEAMLEVTKKNIRHVLLHEFYKENFSTESPKNIKAVYTYSDLSPFKLSFLLYLGFKKFIGQAKNQVKPFYSTYVYSPKILES